MITEDIHFPTDMQTRVYKALSGDTVDVHIEDLFMCAYPGTPIETVRNDKVVAIYEVRELQQRLGPLFHRMNARLAKYGQCIKPGQLKQTYRLSNIDG